MEKLLSVTLIYKKIGGNVYQLPYNRNLYVLFLHSHKPSTKYFNKNEKTHSDIILTSRVSSVFNTSHLCLHFANILALPAFCNVIVETVYSELKIGSLL